MSPIKLSILLLSLMLVASCNFRPVHAKMDNDLASRLASIQVISGPGREDQIIKSHLDELLSPDASAPSPEYRLDITISKEKADLGVQPNSRITRYDVAIVADYKLIYLATNQELDNGKIRIKSSYNRTESEFSTFVAEEDATEKAAEEVAQEFKQRLTAYFSR